MEKFQKLIEQAADRLNDRKLAEAERDLRRAMELDPSAPQAHNLYGVLQELRGDRPLALRHYRAARDLDPCYLPAENNLRRLTRFFPDQRERIDLGDGADEKPEEDRFVVEFDENRVGHIKRKI